MKNGRLRVLALVLADLVCVFGFFALVIWVYRVTGLGYHHNQNYRFFYDLWPFGLCFVVLNAMFRLYHGNPFYPSSMMPPPEELRRLVASSFVIHAGLFAFLAFVLQSTDGYSRFVVAVSCLVTAFLTQPVRNLVRHFMHGFNGMKIPVIIIGPEVRCLQLRDSFLRNEYAGFHVLGCYASPAEVPMDIHADVAIVCLALEGLNHHLKELTSRFSFIEYVPTVDSLPVAGAQTTVFDGFGALEMVNQRRMAILRTEKRVFDAMMSIVAFVVLSPFFIVVPLLIKLTSHGPVFYRQERLGKSGRPILVWKFRSMYVDADARLESILSTDETRRAEWEANFKLADDPRVTPLGRFLRRTSIDEFPQLFNVFAGDMALVGPRPIVRKEVHYYGDAYPIFSSVRPGITGLWQASGRSDTDYARRVALDVHYVLNWSIWMDLWILFRTVGAVLFMRGAR